MNYKFKSCEIATVINEALEKAHLPKMFQHKRHNKEALQVLLQYYTGYVVATDFNEEELANKDKEIAKLYSRIEELESGSDYVKKIDELSSYKRQSKIRVKIYRSVIQDLKVENNKFNLAIANCTAEIKRLTSENKQLQDQCKSLQEFADECLEFVKKEVSSG